MLRLATKWLKNCLERLLSKASFTESSISAPPKFDVRTTEETDKPDPNLGRLLDAAISEHEFEFDL